MSQSISSSYPLPPSPPNNNRTYKILVVDDSKLNRRMLLRSLKANNHRCEEAEDGLEAVNKVRQMGIDNVERYDAILMDFMMPKMDGPTGIYSCIFFDFSISMFFCHYLNYSCVYLCSDLLLCLLIFLSINLLIA